MFRWLSGAHLAVATTFAREFDESTRNKDLNTLPQRFAALVDSAVMRNLYSRLPGLVAVLLVLLIAWTVSQLVWQLIAPSSELDLAPVAPVRPTASAPVRQNFAAQIVASHLFGRQQVAKKIEPKPVDAPETQLNLELRGVYAREDESLGVALIASGSGREKLYKVGDLLPGNAELAAVYPDRVMLKRGGRFETLRLPESKLTGGGFSPYRSRASSRTPGQRGLGMRRAGKVSRTFSANSEIGKLRAEVLKNPAKLAQFVNAVPARQNGRFVGFKIVAKQSHPAFRELDIRSGDVVTEVNGITLDSPQKGFQVLQSLRTAKHVSVTLMRGGQIVQLDHTLE